MAALPTASGLGLRRCTLFVAVAFLSLTLAKREKLKLPACALAHKLVKADKKMGLYKALGLANQRASPKTLKKHYIGMVKQCHPDRHPQDPRANDKAASINLAYSTLSDKKERRMYHQNGFKVEAPAGGRGGGNPFGGGGGNPFGGGGGNPFGGGGNPFGDMFGGGGRRQGGRRGRRRGGGTPFGNQFGGGGGRQQSKKPDAASKQLRDVLIVYYRDVAGVEKSQADINKLASKHGSNPQALYQKLKDRYSKDPKTVEQKIRKMTALLKKYYKKVKEKKSATELSKIVRKYVQQPKALYDKLQGKYGIPVV